VAQEVKLPQLGESVTEGTITAWLVEEGAQVEEDEPLFEISTDKIDTEVPSPASGVLQEIRAQVDDTVEVGEVVAVIAEDGEAAAEDEEPAEEPDEAAEAEAAADVEEREAAAAEEVDEEAETDEEPAEEQEEEEPSEEPEPAPAARTRGDETDGEAALLSPIVRRMVREHDLDPSRIEGSGKGGRITRSDVERAIEAGTAPREAPAATAEAPARAAPAGRKPHENVRGRTEKVSRVRAAIARHMWESLQTTAQLTAAREADVTAIMTLRARAKDAFAEREGVPLSPLPFFARAVCMVLPRHEALNASIDVEAGQVKFYDTINLGIAVDAPQGLIVPNIKDAQDKTVPALAREIYDLADRVRNKKITPDDVQGGTFTVTNTGSRGVLFDTPVLNPPETGILATPTIEKRPVVISRDGSDAIAVRHMTYLCLTYDHRMVDGADAARFLADLIETLEEHDWAAEIGV
jgi:pyruvate dehydrogenase E2 component (dihydrolipoamide acetyltransferase)